MSEKIRISFVVPAHNEEGCLARTLEAITAEVARVGCKAQIIVVDNASTDATRDVAGLFSEVTVVHEATKGLFHARQAGFLAATGELVANVDADTMLPAGWLDRVFLEFDRAPSLVALSGPLLYYDVSAGVRMAVRAFYWVGYSFYLLNRFIFRVGSMLQGGNFVVKQTALAQIGGYNSRFNFYGEDTDLARRLRAVGGVKFTFKLPGLSSGRRLTEEGLVRVGVRYAINFAWATFLHRPFTESWIDIRPDPISRADGKVAEPSGR